MPQKSDREAKRSRSPGRSGASKQSAALDSARPAPPARDGALHALAEREHALHALIDLNRGLSITLDLYTSVDFLLLNLMGQLVTPRASLWLLADNPDASPILIRSHGMDHRVARALMKVCGAQLVQRLCVDSTPIIAQRLEDAFGPATAAILRQEGIAVLAPLTARGATLGFVALGSRLDGTPLSPLDVQVLEAALGIAGVAIQNGDSYNRLLDSKRQLLLAHEELKQLDRRKSEFINNVNHELGTPLGVIIPALEQAMKINPSGELRTCLQNSLNEVRKLAGMIENLSALPGLSGEALSQRVVESDVIPSLVRFHAERLAGIAAGRRELLLVLPPCPLGMRFDDHRLRQILNAMVDHAVESTPAGAKIVLSAAEVVHESNRWVRIEINGDGSGIFAEAPAAGLETMQRLGGSTIESRDEARGLALARDLATKMGGQLLEASTSGRAAKLTLLLRASTISAARAA